MPRQKSAGPILWSCLWLDCGGDMTRERLIELLVIANRERRGVDKENQKVMK